MGGPGRDPAAGSRGGPGGERRPTIARVTTPAPRAIIWDWNGTLLDDVDLCVASLATAMTEHGLEPLDREAYRARFGWPIRDFYSSVGFVTDEAFTAGANHYLEFFWAGVAAVPLQPHAREVLQEVAGLGLRQVLISATRQDQLSRQLAPHDLGGHFEALLGVMEALDPNKEHVVTRWLSRTGLAPGEVVMVGDTNHDEEIAARLGTAFVRFAHGAQAPTPGTDSPLLDDLRDLVPLLRDRLDQA